MLSESPNHATAEAARTLGVSPGARGQLVVHNPGEGWVSLPHLIDDLAAEFAELGGQVITDWPGLGPKALLDNRDLKPTLDLRSVFKAVLDEHMHVEVRCARCGDQASRQLCIQVSQS